MQVISHICNMLLEFHVPKINLPTGKLISVLYVEN